MSEIEIGRKWAMPSADTFDVPPIAEFVRKYLKEAAISVDPFARNKRWATHTNDLNPSTTAEHHLDALDFFQMLIRDKVSADLVILDPPYSVRQVAECYKQVGRVVTSKDTQGTHWKRWRDATAQIIKVGGVVLSFGWNSVGMGVGRGFEIVEILLVCHGGAHNDTICMAERKR